MTVRVIRRVSRRDCHGEPKRAWDVNLDEGLERITAKGIHTCGYYKCPTKFIEPGDVYVQAISPVPWGRRRFKPSPRYHIGCVPPELRPLLRLLKLAER